MTESYSAVPPRLTGLSCDIPIHFYISVNAGSTIHFHVYAPRQVESSLTLKPLTIGFFSGNVSRSNSPLHRRTVFHFLFLICLILRQVRRFVKRKAPLLFITPLRQMLCHAQGGFLLTPGNLRVFVKYYFLSLAFILGLIEAGMGH